MREIIFRGKRRYGKGWAYGSLIATMDGNYCCILEAEDDVHPTDYPYLDGDIGWIDGLATPVIPETVGQYTGLTDKNGKKIFEGDIIKFGINQRLMYVHMNEETLTWELTDVGVSAYEVNHLINTFGLAEIQVESAYGEVFSEIVGNIHDHPELLKGGTDDE